MEKGIWVAPLTPMHEDLSCDIDELANHSLNLIERGCKGIALFGTTGEGASFSVQERLLALSGIIAKGVDPAKIVLANGSANVMDTIQLIQGALQVNVATVLIAPPSLYKNLSEEGVIEYYRTIIQKVNNSRLQILFYHIPQLTGVAISLNIIETLLAEFPDVFIGLKESEGNLAYLKSVRTAFSSLDVYIGKETQIVEGLALGASGAICGFANCFPELLVSLLTAKETPKALIELSEAKKSLHFIPAYKALVEKERGKSWHFLRPPLMPLSNLERTMYLSRVHKVLEAL